MSSSNKPTIYFHVGVPKSGTTYIQYTLHRNRRELRAAGVLYPGRTASHFQACQDLKGWQIGRQHDGRPAGAWSRLVSRLAQWPGRAIIDHELFAGATRPQIDRALSDLSFADVHIVLTARDLARQLPAVWQTRVRTGNGGTYAHFLEAVRSGPPGRGTARPFWGNQAVPNILARWGRDLAPDHVHLITVPPPGSDPNLLWQRFATVIGIDPARFPGAPPGLNHSMGAVEVAFMTRLNERLAGQNLPWPVYVKQFKSGLAPALARGSGARIELPQDAYEWAVEWSIGAVEKLRQANYDVVGDLAELIPRSRPTGADPDTVTVEAQLDAAITGLIELAWDVARGETGGADPDEMAIAP